MPTVKSLEDLKRIREEALQKREIKSAPGSIQIIVGMGTPGIAAGARESLKAILSFLGTDRKSNDRRKCGCDLRKSHTVCCPTDHGTTCPGREGSQRLRNPRLISFISQH